MGCNHVHESFLQFINVLRSPLLEITLRGWVSEAYSGSREASFEEPAAL